ncbi:MAG: hypothetical protein LBB41_04345 [Prevotellaceae bacterium]|jgi:predicted RNase H-like nuclease (RuvC/YqgF family)|nr:hypothetical protein [Prevotellaceae bacterium]
MQKQIIFIVLLFASLTVAAQTPDSTAFVHLQQQVAKLQTEMKSQKNDFSKRISSANEQIKSLQNEITEQKQTVAVLADSLDVKINETATKAETQIVGISENVGEKTIFAIVGGIALLLLSVALFLWLFFKRKTDSANIVKQLEEQKSTIETRLVKEYSTQAEVLENLLKTIREIPITTDGGEPDHSLALKLADEITLMERNISLMDSSTKGLKQLTRSIGKLKDNLAANGYEIPELLGKTYNEGLKVQIINTIQDDNLEQGVQIISKIIKPQVNYQDKMIQAAQIEVSVG